MITSEQVTPRMQRILARAASIADVALGQRIVGTEHVLLATLEDADAIATQVLNELGVREAARAKLEAILASPEYRTPSNARG
jgi:ATP-dependent Clp protease ATP-binding subunit ClpA